MISIHLENRDCYDYPQRFRDGGGGGGYSSPHKAYPEYPFSSDTLNDRPNEVYDMVRSALYGMGLDAARFGTKVWNPLGDYVKPEARILLKPNLVNDVNPIGGLDCTVTHPSVIRCLIDYCVIAKAKIIEVGDAPIQDCEFKSLMGRHGYNRIFEFFSTMGITILVSDFRRTVSKRVSKITDKVFLQEKNKNFKESDTVEFDLKNYSCFNEISGENSYGCINYTDEKVNKLHNDYNHKYLIRKSVFEADLVINVPKPKTHRFAGITGAHKNFIGICSDKEYLPHFRRRTLEHGGDETNRQSILENFYSRLDRKRCAFIERKKILMQYPFCFIQYLILVIKKFSIKKLYLNGLWYGNDTIWRTILDINTILLYGNANGNIDFNKTPKIVLTIGDLIIAGEKSGPLKPSPKPLGIILASDNCALFDYVFCKISGFDYNCIPTIKYSLSNPLLIKDKLSDVVLSSNIKALDKIPVENVKFPTDWKFIPNPSWDTA
jgi:uncharacterized protein (DUF362 family)